MQATIRNVNSEFPFSNRRRSRKSYIDKKSLIKSITETVKEEKKEEEEEIFYKRNNRFSIMRDMNEFGKFGDKKRHSSLDGLKKRTLLS